MKIKKRQMFAPRWRKTLQWRYVAILFSISMLLGASDRLHLTVNLSDSMPKGLYRGAGQALHRGDIVAVCLDNQTAALGLARHYLLKGNRCSNGTAPLIKQIVAIPNDKLTLTHQQVCVNHICYPYPTLTHDSQGRMLPAIARGQASLLTGYFLIGTHAINSWDSRYWGQVSRTQILYRLVPIWVVAH